MLALWGSSSTDLWAATTDGAIYRRSASSGSTTPSGTPSCGTASEGATLNLSCPPLQTIRSITFASYGNPTGACGSFTPGPCNASSSSSVVSAACLNKMSCSLSASNTSFGDPCSGTTKRLNVQVICAQ